MPRLMVGVEGSLFPLDQQHRLIELARQAEDAGVDDLSIPEHVLMGPHASQQDPWSSWTPEQLELPWPEPLVTLAAMAGATRRIRLVSGVVIAPLRPAGLLAKMSATLHVLSRGRFVLGISPSWHKDEYDALGVSFERRGQIMQDAIGACRALWDGAPASFHSPTVNFDNMICSPRPGRGERIPVWFTGKFTPRLVRRVVALGDGWMPFGAYGMTLEELGAAIQQLRERYAAAGRNPATLEVVEGLAPEAPIARMMEQVPPLLAEGVTGVRVYVRHLVTAHEQVPSVLDELVRRFADVVS